MAGVQAVRTLVERVLGPAGPLPALCEEQRRLACIVAEALDAPPGDKALVTLTQAATGTGKTIALLTPVMVLAALQKRLGVRAHRAAYSTFSNHLSRQILDDDAPRVSRALEGLGYPEVSIATRVGRGQFIDHERVLARLQDRQDRQHTCTLESLLAFATFAEAEDHGAFLPLEYSPDALSVTPRSSPSAAAEFDAARARASAADVVLTNHALVLADCRVHGRVLGASPETILFDEADALPEVARSVADDRIDLTLVREMTEALGPDVTGSVESLARLVTDETHRDRYRLLAHCVRRDTILELVHRLGDTLRSASSEDEDAAEEAQLFGARLTRFAESTTSPHAIAAVAAEPNLALAVVHREPVRLLRRLVDRTGNAVFVSATLAVPAARQSPNRFLRALGIAPGMHARARLNGPGWADLEPRHYGTLRFRFADRAAPEPFQRDREPPAAHPAHLDYVARAVEHARKTGRVLVLCTSYQLGEELAERVRTPIVHARGTRLASFLESFRAEPDAVLLTPAAWSGVSLPGLVDHLIIPRIPFRPDDVRDEAKRDFLERLGLTPGAAARVLARDRNADARRKLAQGIGRGIRGPDETCTVWLLDPRFPLPATMARAIGGPGQGRAVQHLGLIHCIPARFRTGRRPAVDEGEIWPC